MNSLRVFSSRLARRDVFGDDAIALSLVVLHEFRSFLRRDRSKSLVSFSERVRRARALLCAASVLPSVPRALSLATQGIFQESTVSKARSSALVQCALAERSLKESSAVLGELVQKKIPLGGTILVHGADADSLLSQAVLSCVKRKNCTVLFLGDSTSGSSLVSQLSSQGVAVRIIPALGARTAVTSSDIVLLGSREVSPDGVLCSLGSGLLLELALTRGIPVYFVAHSWSFSPEEVFSRLRHHHFSRGCSKKSCAPSLEVIQGGKLFGVISELGIYQFPLFVEKVVEGTPWFSQGQ